MLHQVQLSLEFFGMPNVIGIKKCNDGAFSGFQAPIAWQPGSGWIPWGPASSDQSKARIESHILLGDL